MVYVILSVIVLMAIDLRGEKNIKGIIKWLAVDVVCGVIIGLVLWILIGLFVGFALPKKEVVYTKQLYAMQDGSKITGRFYLMGGRIDEKNVIKYITDGSLGKRIETQYAEDSYIKEGYDNPYMEIHKEVFAKDWYRLFAVCSSNEKYVFCVPDGSIINEYNIDLE